MNAFFLLVGIAAAYGLCRGLVARLDRDIQVQWKGEAPHSVKSVRSLPRSTEVGANAQARFT
jgi:hypothetical protein